MFLKKKPAKPMHTFIKVGEREIPARIYVEGRQGVRFSLGKAGAICRLPKLMPENARRAELEKFHDWVVRQIALKGPEDGHALGKTYADGDILTVGSRSYHIKLELTDHRTHAARLEGGTIHLRLAKDDAEAHRTKAVRQLLSRVVAQDFLPHIKRRVMELNHLFFRREIKGVSLKYNTSNWGSCSSAGNINLSTCLLFAPDDVVDYVIIHELAHLLEMNHSPRFWKHVEDAMPDYKEKKKWLRRNWHSCNF